jgi:hypothetical protein
VKIEAKNIALENLDKTRKEAIYLFNLFSVFRGLSLYCNALFRQTAEMKAQAENDPRRPVHPPKESADLLFGRFIYVPNQGRLSCCGPIRYSILQSSDVMTGEL